MEFGRRWKIRTSFGWVLLSVRAPGDPEPKRDAAARDREQQARFHLRYELGAASDTPSQPLREVQRFFSGDDRGFGAHDRAPAETELTSLDAMIETELVARRIELDFEPFWTESLTEREFEGEAPPLKPLRPPEPETSFIAVNLLDQDGKPVIGRRWTIELPDGSKHSGVTDFEGWARVKGFTKDGTAKISFPQFDELDHQTRASAERVIEPIEGEEEAEEELETDEEEQEEVEEEESADSEQTPESLPLAELAGAAELVEQAAKSETELVVELLDQDGAPVASRDFIVTLTDGRELTGTTGQDGVARIRDVTEPGIAKISFPDFDQSDFDFAPALPGKSA